MSERFRPDTIHRRAYKIASETFANVESLTDEQVGVVENDRRGRRRMIHSLQQSLKETSGEERRRLLEQLHDLESHQFASRYAIEKRSGKRFF